MTDVLQGLSYLPGRALLEFHPDMRPDLTNWWALTPVGVERMLHVLGFLHTECWFHFQRRKDPGGWVETPLFTVVGRRAEGKPPRPQITLQEQERQKELATAWEQRTERELLDTRAALEAMRQSSSWRLTRGLRLAADFLKRRKGN